MILQATYILEVHDVDQIYSSIVPELSVSPTNVQRSRVVISKKRGKLIISLEAEDISSFRAATNTWLRLVSVAAEMESILSKERT
jgi:tRNA threonylcarbamoyladenosine modification (KEOPS) complex  Pcc1 subunit